jgi:hypothetical protein
MIQNLLAAAEAARSVPRANSEYGIMLGDFLCEQIAKEYGWKGMCHRIVHAHQLSWNRESCRPG